MTTRNLQARLLFDGGWSTDFGPTAPVAIGQNGILQVPFLIDAENCVYDLDGGPGKIGGTERINSTALKSGSTIRGLVDYWKLGTGASATQKRIVHVGNDVMADAADGTFVTILAAADRVTTSIPSYAVYDDDLIIMSDANEAPLKYTGSGNAATLGTNTPVFAFGVTHKNRFWGAGVRTNKSRLYYSEPLPNGADGDWDEVEAGFIDIETNDGDEIRGLVSHKGILFVFKGPYNGSIWTIKGDTPLGGVTAFASSTQPIPFEKDIFVRGLGAAGHNSIFRFKDDIGFIDAKTGSVRSLNATDQFGDFREAALSFPINDFLKNRLNKAELKGAWAVPDVSRGGVAITVPIDSSTTNNTVLYMDYRFDPPRWSHWPAVVGECMASVIDVPNNNRQSIFLGDTSGFVRRTQIPNRSIDETTGINYKVTLPYLDFGNPVAFKTLARGSVGISPKGNYNGTFGWARDDKAQQTTTFDQGGGDVLAGTVTTRGITGAAANGSDTTFTVSGFTQPYSVGDSVAIYYSASPGDGYNGVYTVTAVNAIVPFTFDVTVTFITGTDAQAGTSATSTTAHFFTLGTSTLAGARFVDRFFELEEGGEFRSVQFQVTQGGLNQDIEIHSLFVEMEVGADSTEN